MKASSSDSREKKESELPPPCRIESIDALRGFTMFWIIGGNGVFLGFVKLFSDPVPPAIAQQFCHPAWGPTVTFLDLIMPLFLFIVGTAMPFSLGKRLETSRNYWRIYGKIFRRIALLWILGMVVMGNLLTFDPDKIRVAGNVLQYIACGYLVGAVALLHLQVRGQLILAFGLLLGYCLMMLYIPIPGKEAGVLTANVNLARYIDGLVIGRYNGFPLAPTILSSMSLGASVLLGIMAGHILRLRTDPWLKVRYLVIAGTGLLVLGWLWGHWFMMIKWLWTSSYALWMAGWSYLLLAVFYSVIDVLGFRRWAFPFRVIGANAILAYTLCTIYGRSLYSPLVGGLANHVGVARDLVLSLGQVGILWFILWYLYRQRTFIRV